MDMGSLAENYCRVETEHAQRSPIPLHFANLPMSPK